MLKGLLPEEAIKNNVMFVYTFSSNGLQDVSVKPYPHEEFGLDKDKYICIDNPFFNQLDNNLT